MANNTSTANSNAQIYPSTSSTSSTSAYNQIDPVIMAYIDSKLKSRSTAQIKADGDVQVKLGALKIKSGVLWLVGIVATTLAIFGCIAYLQDPDKSSGLWAIIGPIISASVTGVVAYLSGEKNASE